MKKKMLKYWLCLFCLLTEFAGFCQDFPSEDEEGDLQGDDAAAVPVNGKLIWLGVAAVLFAFYKFRSVKAENNAARS